MISFYGSAQFWCVIPIIPDVTYDPKKLQYDPSA